MITNVNVVLEEVIKTADAVHTRIGHVAIAVSTGTVQD